MRSLSAGTATQRLGYPTSTRAGTSRHPQPTRVPRALLYIAALAEVVSGVHSGGEPDPDYPSRSTGYGPDGRRPPALRRVFRASKLGILSPEKLWRVMEGCDARSTMGNRARFPATAGRDERRTSVVTTPRRCDNLDLESCDSTNVPSMNRRPTIRPVPRGGTFR